MTVSAKVGKQEKMMYPDRHRIPKISADDYDKQTAEEVLNLTRLILELLPFFRQIFKILILFVFYFKNYKR
jgi:hypothetical protein